MRWAGHDSEQCETPAVSHRRHISTEQTVNFSDLDLTWVMVKPFGQGKDLDQD
jgi:hypothetical protein